MAEVVGLVFGALGVSGLFSACIENFDIIVRARDFGDEFELLCTQRVRLVLWGESLGLVPGPAERGIPYNKAVDRDDIRPAIESTLFHLCQLLQKADVVSGRYELKDEAQPATQDVQQTISTGLTIFRDRFESFKSRIRRNQKKKSTWTVTRWAIHDFARFKMIINHVKDLVDGLEGITRTLGVLEHQQALLAEEIESISDTRSLHLLRDVASSHEASPSLRVVSDAASIRLSIAESGPSAAPPRSRLTESTRSYYTVPSHQQELSSLPPLEEEASIYGYSRDAPPLARVGLRSIKKRAGDTGPEARPLFPVLIGQHASGISTCTRADGNNGTFPKYVPAIGHVPQNQRLIAELMSKTAPTQLPELKFDSGASHYGDAMATVKRETEESWKQQSTGLLVNADKGMPAARRVFLELRSIRNAGVPFISASPIRDCLDKVLASIEGPPDTPYEGGIFWISVMFPEMSSESPLLRFQTKIYHPNIDCNGNICADYQTWWNDPNLQRYMSAMGTRAKAAWFSEKTSSRYSLGALLTALCGLLASPNIEDPLVPEIAAAYITDYAGYCEKARLYTNKFATGRRPSVEAMSFEDVVSLVGVKARPAGQLRTQSSSHYIFDNDSSWKSAQGAREMVSDEDGASTCGSTPRQRPRYLPVGEGKELRDKDFSGLGVSPFTPKSPYATDSSHEPQFRLHVDPRRHGADADSRCGLGRTPSCPSAENEHEAAIKLLLDTGRVDPDSKDLLGQIPLLNAAMTGDETALELLFSDDADGLDSGNKYCRMDWPLASRMKTK